MFFYKKVFIDDTKSILIVKRFHKKKIPLQNLKRFYKKTETDFYRHLNRGSTYSLRFPISCRLGQRHGLQNITLTNIFC
jgi:hypothetical protein